MTELARRALLAETFQDILAALAELQKRRIPTEFLGELQTINEQLWDIVFQSEEEL